VIDFQWTRPASSAGVDRYVLETFRVGAPASNIWRSPTEQYRLVQCGFVIDAFLEDWRWRVKAIDGDGVEGPWSVVVPFRYGPCRVGTRPCSG
jgi:hypothetical protein